MVRKTALVTAMLGAFASQAFAMGLGDIRLASVLNQPLHAEIELLSPTATDLAELRVALASNEAYNRAGVERAYFHTKLRFEVLTRPDGTAAIKVTSREPVREPYLDFLLEATWGSGQVLREYTVLVDPPAMMPAPKPQTQAPRATAPTPRSVAAPVSPRPAAARSHPTGQLNGEYHTSRNDTLWSIAEAVRPDRSLSIEQTMLGLLEANPDAFYDQNINNLKAGHILRVPGRDEIAAVGSTEALNEVRRQNGLWRDGRTRSAPTSDAPAATPVAPTDTATGAAAEAEPDAQLKLIAPDTGTADGAAANGIAAEDLRQELTLAVEAVEAQRQENAELSARLQQLEEQIAQLHRLIELKDSGLSQLSGTAAPSTDGAVAIPEEPLSGMEGAPGDGAAVSEGLALETQATAPGQPDATADLTTDMDAEASQASDAQVPEATMAPEATAVVPVADASPVVDPAVEPAAEPVAAPASTEQNTLASLLANPLLTWGAAGAAVLVALLAWLGRRRRRLAEGDFQESILAERHGDMPSPAAGDTAAGSMATGAAAVAAEPVAEAPAKAGVQSDSSLFTDFAVSDMGAIQNDAEADPIAEADVYLAYGRYQQAEELIRGALDRSPQRSELRLKLLEVLFAAKNANAFDTEAEVLLANTEQKDSETWQRVAEMGRELNPSSPLYRDGEAAVAEQAAPTAPDADEAALDMVAGEASLDLGAEEAPADDNSLDFDMDELASFVPAEEPQSALAADEDLSFDLTDNEDPEDVGDGMLSSSDEVATKLDLARAYVEMGDPDGARSILDEVLQEGSTGQQSEAQTLLQQIG